jgi:hypothetical protein
MYSYRRVQHSIAFHLNLRYRRTVLLLRAHRSLSPKHSILDCPLLCFHPKTNSRALRGDCTTQLGPLVSNRQTSRFAPRRFEVYALEPVERGIFGFPSLCSFRKTSFGGELESDGIEERLGAQGPKGPSEMVEHEARRGSPHGQQNIRFEPHICFTSVRRRRNRSRTDGRQTVRRTCTCMHGSE